MKVLDLTLPTPAENLACDEALLQAAEAGHTGECLRFWESPTHFIVVGYANQVEQEVNVPACGTAEIPILRRCSGGGTVLQGPGCLNYAVVLRITETGPTSSISAANQFIMERTRAAIAALLPSSEITQVQGCTDLTLNGQKFSGNAQRRLRRFLLFHGAILLGLELRLVPRFLRMPQRQPEYRRQRSHEEFITNLALNAVAVKSALSSAWAASSPGDPPSRQTLEALVTEKYSRAAWNRLR